MQLAAPCIAFYNASGLALSACIIIVLNVCFTASRLCVFSLYTACRPIKPSPEFCKLSSRVSVHGRPPFGSRVGPATRVPRFVPGFSGHLFSGLPRILVLRKGCVPLRPVLLSFSALSCDNGRSISCLIPTCLTTLGSLPLVGGGGGEPLLKFKT